MMDLIESIIGPVTGTRILSTLLIILILYYLWPVFNNPVSHVPGPFVYPIVGNILGYFKNGLGPNDIILKKKYGKIFRVYEGRQPSVVIGDAKKLRHVLVKSFSTFVDRRDLMFRDVFKYSLFDATGDNWRRQRHLMTPSFTTGKLKKMQLYIQQCVDRFCKNIDKLAESGEEFEAKTYAGMFTMDVIASTGFGIELDSQADPNNPFVTNAREIFDISISDPAFMIAIFTPFLIPLFEWFGYSSIPKKNINFFRRMLEPMIKERKESPNIHVDILQVMVDSQHGEMDQEAKKDLTEQGNTGVEESIIKKGLTDNELIAQALFFFLAAYDTTASTLSFLLYELSRNQDVQDKLCEEVSLHMKGKNVTYENVWNIEYLDQCIMETLRLYPPVQRIDRMCHHDIDVDGLFIPKRTVVIAPVFMLQRDPEIWEDPEKFDPSRFSPDAKAARDQFYHLPFGLGPRQCIGMRLALLELKMVMVPLIQQFRFLPSQKPFELDYMLFVRTKSGAWLKAARR